MRPQGKLLSSCVTDGNHSHHSSIPHQHTSKPHMTSSPPCNNYGRRLSDDSPQCRPPRSSMPIVSDVTPVTFHLRLPDTWNLHNAFHVQLLKPYKDPNQQFQGRQLPPPPPVLVQDEPEYEVERVLTHRRRGGKTLEFLLRWKGYDPTEDSWVVEDDMGNARRALKDYLVKLGVSHATQL
ncbi:unnamed protein product [Closterium sp. NIES-53]